MKLHIMSDIHLEFGSLRYNEDLNPDVLVLAGDIGTGKLQFNWMEIFVPSRIPIVYVAGNHEYYNRNIVKHTEALRERAKASTTHHIHFLENDSVTIDGQKFVGGTLWTDFNLYNDVARGAIVARTNMNDFRVIEGMTIDAWLERNRATTQYIRENVDRDTIVVTHMSPTPRSIHPKYDNDECNVAQSSNLLSTLEVTPKLWIHGHTHESFDYVERDTRVICNPRGYAGHELNPMFNPNLIVEI